MKKFLRRAIFELTVPPLRPRYQERHMRRCFMDHDRKYSYLREDQFADWCNKRRNG